MSKLFDKLQADMHAALKAQSAVELNTLRMLKSDIQYEMTKDGSKDLSDDQVEALIRRAIKRRRESIEQFEKAGRVEMAANERAEAEILERYLPPAIPEADILKAIDEVIAKVKPAGPADAGKVMGPVMGRFKGQGVDGARVKELVQSRLAGG